MKKERKNSLGEVCVHYFSKVPNNEEGLNFIKSIRKFVNKKKIGRAHV